MNIQEYTRLITNIYKYPDKFIGVRNIELMETSTPDKLQLNLTPSTGKHKDIEMRLQLDFKDEISFPKINVYSEIYNEIKTNQLINNIGNNGNHKGLCIPNYSNHHGTNFNKSFNKYVNSDWINYLNQLIDYLSVMENLGSGIQKIYQNKTTI